MKKYLSLLLALLLALSLTACGGSKEDPAKTEEPANVEEPAAEPVEIIVFAAASMQESLNAAIEGYKAVAPEVTVVTTYDSSGTLLTQIKRATDDRAFRKDYGISPRQYRALREPAQHPQH